MSQDSFSEIWKSYSYVFFDIETTGAWPVGNEICELALIKVKEGEITKTWSSLIKPKRIISNEIIAIHGITNEMVQDAPSIEDVIGEVKNFFDHSLAVAHHAPFDLGFLAWEFEKASIPFPHLPCLCTSLLSRSLIPESPNHKLQTLIPFLHLKQGAAHRAYDDTYACYELFLKCLERLGDPISLSKVLSAQKKKLNWNDFSILNIMNQTRIQAIFDALIKKRDIEFVYQAGTFVGKPRRATPIGIVRNPDGDYLYAFCHLDKSNKRFYLNKISESTLLWE